MSQDLVELMTDVRDRVIRIETRIEVIPKLEAKVAEHSDEILEARTSVRLLKWIGGAVLATVAAIAAVMKTFQ